MEQHRGKKVQEKKYKKKKKKSAVSSEKHPVSPAESSSEPPPPVPHAPSLHTPPAPSSIHRVHLAHHSLQGVCPPHSPPREFSKMEL